MQQSIKDGKSLRTAFHGLYEKKIIDSVTWSLISIADNSGDVSSLFKSIAEYTKEKRESQYALFTSLMYPVGMISLSFCMVIVLITVIFPKMMPLFKSMNADIPFLTHMMIQVSELLVQYMYIIVGLVILTVTSCIYAIQTKRSVRKFFHQTLLTIPVISDILLFRILYSVSFTSALLMRSGRSITDICSILSDTSSYIPIQESLIQVGTDISEGKSVSSAFSRASYFNHEWNNLIHIGEHTGKLPEMFKDMSTIYKNKHMELSKIVSKLSEPIALLITGAVVLVVALSVVQPMYSILNVIQK